MAQLAATRDPAASYRLLAPFLRGYEPATRCAGDYYLVSLAEDLLRLMAALNIVSGLAICR